MSLSSTTRPATSEGRAGQYPGVVLAVIVACQMMVVVDATAMAVALPEIQSGLHFSSTGLAWVLNAYILPYAGLLLLGGRTGDVFGRRRTFVAGVALFTASSLLGGLAPSPGWLLAARALQGVGAAFAAPGAMSLLMANFAEGPARNRALAGYSTVAGLGMAIGMIASGVLTDVASWRWVLLVNVPIGLAIVVLTPRLVAEPPRNPGRLDVPGALAATAGLSVLAWAFINASAHGWSGATPVALVAAVVLLALFVLRQSRAAQPLMPLRLLADRNRTSGYLAMAFAMASNFTISLFVPMFLQDVLHYSALSAGLAFLPMALTVFVVSRSTRRLLPLWGPRPLILGGLALCAVGIGWLSRLDGGSSYAGGVLVPLFLLGLGIGTFLMPLTGLILGGVPPQDAGAASGVLQTFQQSGGALGIAVLITVYGSSLRHAAPDTPRAAATAHGIGAAFTGATAFLLLALLLIALTALPLRRAAGAGAGAAQGSGAN
ncbi:MFS transporter [Kitasatospora sp. NPDC001540]|uniref:MFS transporter n=1 Tax=Kitasatospora sp. NPDC001540 TaxID=3364014 RepID=UPI0036BF2C7B